MKEVKIGEKKYQRIDDLFDIGDERFLLFKQYLLQSLEDVNKPSFLMMHQKIIKFFNANENYNIIVELENYKKALELSKLNYDCFSMCFALLHLEDGEKQSDLSDEKLKNKLKEMRDAGLTRGTVEEVVGNFMKASPKDFNHYLVMLEAMSYLSSEEISNASQN